MINQLQNIIKDINISQIIQPEFWLRNQGPANLPEIIWLLGIYLAVILLGLTFLLYNRLKVGYYPPKNKILKPAGIGPIVGASVGAFFVLFRWQGIDFLGVRLYHLLIVLVSLGWTAYFFYLYRRKVPQQSIEYETRLIKKKYLSK